MRKQAGRDLQKEKLARYIGERLAIERETLGEGQVEFGERIGLSQPQCHRVERGKRPITAPDLYLLAEQLQLPIEEFFPPQDQAGLLLEERELIEAWRKRDLRSLLALVASRCCGD